MALELVTLKDSGLNGGRRIPCAASVRYRLLQARAGALSRDQRRVQPGNQPRCQVLLALVSLCPHDPHALAVTSCLRLIQSLSSGSAASTARLGTLMEAALIIRTSMAEVTQLRESAIRVPELAAAITAIKHYQSIRFEHSYRDLIAGGPFQAAARFFLNELYGHTDFSRRDSQFSRIAGTMERLLPEPTLSTAVALAQLHVLTEQLDHSMGKAWIAQATQLTSSERYVMAWRSVGQHEQRLRQLHLVLTLGQDLERLTHKPGLRLLLKVMRKPAQAAGLAELQGFLETGFDIFSSMARQDPGVSGFLNLINERETAMVTALSSSNFNVAQAIHDGVLPAGSGRKASPNA